jgi:hypothetical protein
MKTPKAGLMCVNAKFWGQDPQREQIEFIKQFHTLAECKSAVGQMQESSSTSQDSLFESAFRCYQLHRG